MEAQRQAVINFTRCTDCIISEFTEIESGKKADRKILHAAIAEAKSQNATLVIAKLDRLSRNAAFTFALMDAKVDFVCCDMPDANSLTIGIMAVLAQHEAKMISERTKAALKAKRASGWKRTEFTEIPAEQTAKASKAASKAARSKKENIQATELCKLYNAQGLSLRAIAAKLNEGGYKTSMGCEFKAVTVKRLLERI